MTDSLDELTNDFLTGLMFCVHDAGRDNDFWDDHLLSYLSQDILGSCAASVLLVRERLFNSCKRELRFIIELAIKQCYVEQQMSRAPVGEKIERYRKLFSGSSISVKSDIDLFMLSEDLRLEFGQEIGRLYGTTSDYVHLSMCQVLERIDLVRRGVMIGHADPKSLNDVIDSFRRCYAMVLTLLFHSVPSHVAGDWLVERDGASNRWCFRSSKYIAGIDSYFDYKHERKARLGEIRAERARHIAY